jgi:hypothetical protein
MFAIIVMAELTSGNWKGSSPAAFAPEASMAYGHNVNTMNMALLGRFAIIPKHFANFASLFQDVEDSRLAMKLELSFPMRRCVEQSFLTLLRILLLANKPEFDISHPSAERPFDHVQSLRRPLRAAHLATPPSKTPSPREIQAANMIRLGHQILGEMMVHTSELNFSLTILHAIGSFWSVRLT